MGWYIELQCDGPDDCGGNSDGPRGRSTKLVAAEARRNGWRQVGAKWFCPACSAHADAAMAAL